MDINAFEINFLDVEIQNVKTKVASFPWHEMPKDGGWSFGTNIDYMKSLADYWTKEYDWKSQEARLNQFPNYKTKVDDLDIHFIIRKSSSPKAIPLILIPSEIKLYSSALSLISSSRNLTLNFFIDSSFNNISEEEIIFEIFTSLKLN